MKDKVNLGKIVGKMALVFICALLILTFASGLIDSILTPEVMAVPAVKDNLKTEVTVRGTAAFEKTQAVGAPFGGNVVSVNVREGESIPAGALMAVVSTEDIEIMKIQNEIDRLRLEQSIKDIENTVKELKKSGTSTSYERDKLANQKKQLELQLEILHINIDKLGNSDISGEIAAEFDCTVVRVFINEEERVSASQPMFEVIPASEPYIGTMTVNETVKDLISGEVLRLSFGGVQDSVNAQIESYESLGSGMYRLSLNIKAARDKIDLSKPAEFTVENSITVASNVYIIPKSSVILEQMSGKGRIYVLDQREGFFGPETIVKEIPVNIEGANDYNYGVTFENIYSAGGADIKYIVYASKPVSDGQKVKLM